MFDVCGDAEPSHWIEGMSGMARVQPLRHRSYQVFCNFLLLSRRGCGRRGCGRCGTWRSTEFTTALGVRRFAKSIDGLATEADLALLPGLCSGVALLSANPNNSWNIDFAGR